MSARTPYILLTFANPHKIPKEYLPFLNKESALVYEHLEKFAVEDKCDVNRLPGATVEQIFDTIEKWQARKDLILFHYGGHASGSELLLNTDDGGSRSADADGFAELLGNLPSLQLVFLNGCSTKGQVELLLEKGVKTVIATSAPVQDQMAVDFASRFYQNLAAGETIGDSFDQARKFLKTKYKHGVLSSQESRDVVYKNFKNMKSADLLPWGIYHHEGATEALNWKLPQEIYLQEKSGLRRFLSPRILIPFIALLGLISAGTYFISNQTPKQFNLSLYLYSDSAKSASIETGELRLVYENSPDASYPVIQGRVKLRDIPVELRAKSFKIVPQIKGFSETQIPATFPAKENSLDIIIPREVYQTAVSGNIKDSAGNAVEGAMILFGSDTTYTNSLGDFQMSLPFQTGTRKRMRVIFNQKEVYNGEEIISANPLNVKLR